MSANVITGNLLFDYGGCYQDLSTNESKKKIHNLGIAIQDTCYESVGENNDKYKCSLAEE